MVAFNFSPEFADAVASGAKRQTIRQTKRAKVGDRLQLYTGQRTKQCRKLIEPDPVCTVVDYCAVRPDYLTLGDVRLHPRDIDEFARADGFADYAAMVAWFKAKYGSPFFIGYVHKWAHAA